MGGMEKLRREKVQIHLCGVSRKGPERILLDPLTERMFWQPCRGVTVVVACWHEFNEFVMGEFSVVLHLP